MINSYDIVIESLVMLLDISILTVRSDPEFFIIHSFPSKEYYAFVWNIEEAFIHCWKIVFAVQKKVI